MYYRQLIKIIFSLSLLGLTSCNSSLSITSTQHLSKKKNMEIDLKKVAEIEQGYGYKLAFAQDGHTWATAKLGAVYLWQDFQLQKAVTLPGYIKGSLHFSEDDKSLVAGSVTYQIQNEQIQYIPNIQEQLIAEIPPEANPRPELFAVVNAVWSPDAQEVVIFTKYNPPRELGSNYTYEDSRSRLLLLSGQTGELKQILEHDCGIADDYSIAISDEWIAAGSDSVSVWERKTGQKVAQLAQKPKAIRNLQFNRNGSQIAAVRSDGTIEVWKTTNWTSYATWQGHDNLTRAVAFHLQLPLLITGGDDGQLKIWSLDTSEPELITSISFDDKIEGIAFEPTRGRLVVASRFRDSKIYWYEFVATGVAE